MNATMVDLLISAGVKPKRATEELRKRGIAILPKDIANLKNKQIALQNARSAHDRQRSITTTSPANTPNLVRKQNAQNVHDQQYQIATA